MIVFRNNAFALAPERVPEAASAAASTKRAAAWKILPLAGAFELSYLDANGRPSLRRISAVELKVGPGKMLLGGVDADLDEYRGFRVDRIRSLTALDSGEMVSRNILDWLSGRASRQERERNRAASARARRPAAAEALAG